MNSHEEIIKFKSFCENVMNAVANVQTTFQHLFYSDFEKKTVLNSSCSEKRTSTTAADKINSVKSPIEVLKMLKLFKKFKWKTCRYGRLDFRFS